METARRIDSEARPEPRGHDAQAERDARHERDDHPDRDSRHERDSKHERDADAVFRAMLEGDLRLVDVFERDGLRCLIGRRAPAHERRALFDPREIQVLSLRARGYPLKWIAHDMKLSQATVSRTVVLAKAKLGVQGETDLVRFAPRPSSNTLLSAPHGSRVWTASNHALVQVLTYAASVIRVHPALTAAEQNVVELSLRGVSTVAIAELRGTSQFTIKNQIRVAYEKLGVQGRVELARAMTSVGDEGKRDV